MPDTDPGRFASIRARAQTTKPSGADEARIRHSGGTDGQRLETLVQIHGSDAVEPRVDAVISGEPGHTPKHQRLVANGVTPDPEAPGHGETRRPDALTLFAHPYMLIGQSCPGKPRHRHAAPERRTGSKRLKI